MIRTKYLLVTIAFCVGVIVFAGFWSVGTQTRTTFISKGEVLLSAPRDGYQVVPNTNDGSSIDREAFIMRIRHAMLNEPVQKLEANPVDSATGTNIVE